MDIPISKLKLRRPESLSQIRDLYEKGVNLVKKNPIHALRDQIDSIDRKIIRLISQRATCAVKMGKLKQLEKLPAYDGGREREILEAIISRNKGPLPDLALRHIFNEIISGCRSLQGTLTIAYLGPEATFTHQAALEKFGHSSDFRPCDTVAEVFRDVESGRSKLGVIPIENSSEGSVASSLDQLALTELKIYGEIYRRISQVLISRETDLNSIRCVYSHPQALAQCANWLAAHLPGRSLVQMSSTAVAARRVMEEQYSAAVGSEMLADIYGLNALARDIQDNSVNLTRFLVIGVEESQRTGRDKTSIVFASHHRPGALRQALAPFADQGINITRIESRPAKEQPWEYIFFIDFEGHISDPHVKATLEELRNSAVRVKMLGSYPVGEMPALRDRVAGPLSELSSATSEDQEQASDQSVTEAGKE